ncbi:MAG: ATP-grasp domain-containing protein [Allosphingosinicella sp.]
MIRALQPAFEARGWALEEVLWQTAHSFTDPYDAYLLGTCWDYTSCPDWFLAAITRLSERSVVLNSPELVKWNLHKTYLKRLACQGIPSIPTVWLENVRPETLIGARESLGVQKVVVKRATGASAIGQHLTFGDDSLVTLAYSLDPSYEYFMQPFLKNITATGERSLIFFGSEFSHAVLKRPRRGDYRVQSLYGGTEEKYDPLEREIHLGQRIISLLPELPLYARIDLVSLQDGREGLMECECIEPYLYPNFGPSYGDAFSRAVEARLESLSVDPPGFENRLAARER